MELSSVGDQVYAAERILKKRVKKVQFTYYANLRCQYALIIINNECNYRVMPTIEKFVIK